MKKNAKFRIQVEGYYNDYATREEAEKDWETILSTFCVPETDEKLKQNKLLCPDVCVRMYEDNHLIKSKLVFQVLNCFDARADEWGKPLYFDPKADPAMDYINRINGTGDAPTTGCMCGMLIAFFVVFWCFSSCVNSCQRHFEKEKEMKAEASYIKHNCGGAAIFTDSVTSSDGTKKRLEDLPPREYREALVNAFNEQAARMGTRPDKVKARIDGDTLWLFSYSFRSRGGLAFAVEEYKNVGLYGHFAKVNLCIGDFGGAAYYTIYEDPSAHEESLTPAKTKTKTKVSKKKRVAARTSDIDDAIDDEVHERLNEALSEYGLEESDIY